MASQIFWFQLLIITFCLVLQPTTANCNGIYCSVEITGAYPQILPRSAVRSAVGYDGSLDTIIILGGSSNKQYVSFTASTFEDNGENYMTDGVYGTGQYYSQLENTLWMINDDTPSFITMDTQSRAINYLSAVTIPNAVGSRGCLATMDYNNHQYLFVIGGWNSNDGYLNLIQVYNVNLQQWSNLPPMQTARRSAACIIHNNDILYVMGGKSSNGLRVTSVEYFNIGDYFANMPNQQWTYTNGNLNAAIDSCGVVSYGNDILIIGGIDNESVLPTDINVINTVTNSVAVNGSLVNGVLNPSVIVVGNMLYVFGVAAQYEYINLYPTSNPTKSPTLNPSVPPTLFPTSNPTQSPILNPTNIPTSNPSVSPSLFPTNSPVSPTGNPSKIPSALPTVSPTRFPTISPVFPTVKDTIFPTFSPTVNPLISSYTGNPTISVTNAPTNSPSKRGEGSIVDSYSTTEYDSNETDKMSQNNNEIQWIEQVLFLCLGFGMIILIISCVYCCWQIHKRKKKRLQTMFDRVNSNHKLGTENEIEMEKQNGAVTNKFHSKSLIKYSPFKGQTSPKRVQNASLHQQIITNGLDTLSFKLDAPNDDDVDAIINEGEPVPPGTNDAITTNDDGMMDDIIGYMATPMGDKSGNANDDMITPMNDTENILIETDTDTTETDQGLSSVDEMITMQ